MPSQSISVVVAHNVFLSREQRYLLNEEPNTAVSGVGSCVPVWCKGALRESWSNNEPAPEVICRYTVTNRLGDQLMTMKEDGWQINLATKNVCGKLLDLKDLGCECANFSHRSSCEARGREYPIIHFVNIYDESVLQESLTTNNRPATD